jgi:uncharacterized membrane protein
MDDVFSILLVVGIVLFVLIGPWVLLARSSSRRRREREEDQERWRDAVFRIYELERAVARIRDERAATPAARQQQGPPPVDAEKAPASPTWSTPAPTAATFENVPPPERAPVSDSIRVAQDWVTQRTAPPAEAIGAQRLAEPSAAAPPPSFSTPGPSLADRLKSALDIEEMLGTNWLNKVGVAMLVLGVAFFLAYQLKTLGPAGKVLVGLAASGVLLGAGIWAERHERYRILARAGVGGGWALLFFTTYAMYHIPAAQILASQATDLVLMLAVAAALVAHTLRYRSQVVTGLAFLLAFLTVSVSHSNVYSLSAGAVLAAGLVVIVGRMQWFELEVFGIVASYLNHYLWLRPVIEPMQGKHRPFPEFQASAGLLALYWLIFRLSYVFRSPNSERKEHVSTAAALLNTALLLALFKYQSAHPEWAFWALLAIGAIETLLGQLPVTRRRRSAVIVLSTLGVILLIAAFPFRYSEMRLSVLWLLEAEALLLIGSWTREVVFRRLGMVASVLVAGQMIAVEAARVFGRRMDGADVSADFALAVVFVVAAAVFYASAHWIARRWSDLFTAEFDRRVMNRLSYAAAVMLSFAAWLAFPEAWTAVAWGALGLALTMAAKRLAASEFRYQALALAAASVVRVLAMNLDATQKWHGLTLRLVTILLVSVFLYVATRWSSAPEAWFEVRGRPVSIESVIFGAYTWPASFLLALLAWYELQPVGVAEAWMAGGLILVELGLARAKPSLRRQGYVMLAASFLRIFIVNLNAAGGPGEVSPRFYTVVPVALAFYYAYWRLHEASPELTARERKFRMHDIFCWLGTASFVALVRFELEADWVAAAWSALVFALFAVSWRSGRAVFLQQGLLLTIGILFRTVLHNFYERSYFPAPRWESRWITVGATVAFLIASLPVAFKLRRKDEPSTRSGLVRLVGAFVRRPEQVVFFTGVGILTTLLALEMRHGMVTLSWGVEGVAVFMLALWLGERSFRLTGLGLLLLCVGRILLVDVWRLDPRDRYLTFIVLGGALLLVSFLYTRNRERLRQYL